MNYTIMNNNEKTTEKIKDNIKEKEIIKNPFF